MDIVKNASVNDVTYDVRKQVSEAQGSAFQLEDVSELVQRREVTPKLLTAIMGGEARETTNRTDTYKYDDIAFTAQIPDGKAYTDYGKDITKDRPRQLIYSIPSFGIKFNVSPTDYVGRRKPGTTDFLTEADIVAQMTDKSENVFTLLDELGWANLLTTDTNIIRGGPYTQYNFYTEITGGARGSATSMELDQASADHAGLARAEKKALLMELGKSMDSATRIVVLCGDTFFNQRLEIERNQSLARPLKSEIDLASQEVGTDSWGSMTFNYDWFKGALDGLTYINYGAEVIAGTNLIADTAAYMIPLGSSYFTRAAYAPAVTRQYVNTEALKMYAWTNVDDRQGVTSIFETNKLFSYINPRYVRVLVNT